MIELTLGRVAQIISADCPQDLAQLSVSRVCTDSRCVKPGDLFFALAGDNFDAHDFLPSCFDAGAAAAVVEKECKNCDDLPLLKVPSARMALGQLAAAVRQELKCHVVAITGSNGKTTTRRMLASILRQLGSVCEAPASFNNDIGVPLTILAASREDEFLLTETGTNHPGEIDYLGRIVRPHVAIITGASASHLAGFDDSVEAVAAEKVSLLDHLVPGGLAIVNGDQPILCKAVMDKPVRKALFGLTSGLMWQCRDVRLGPDGSVFRAAEDLQIRLKVPGQHNISNALAALIAAGALGATPQQIITGLADFEPPSMRLQTQQVGEITIINDAYNANPASMSAALEVFKLTPAQSNGRKVAVLGDMLELGSQSEQLHRQLGESVASSDIDLLITVGPLAQHIARGAIDAGMDKQSIKTFGNDDGDFAKMANLLQPHDTVLLKASRGMKMERLLGLLSKGV